MTQILDTSVVLAYLLREPGSNQAEALLGDAQVSAVNFCEAASKLMDFGHVPGLAWDRVIEMGLAVHPFDAESARIAASLRPISRPYGLSFADRACLALGIKLGLPVYTADRAWAKLRIGVDIRLIR